MALHEINYLANKQFLYTFTSDYGSLCLLIITIMHSSSFQGMQCIIQKTNGD